jgi:hypothetical protein
VAPNRRNAIRAFGKPYTRDSLGCANLGRKLGVKLIGGGPACARTTGPPNLLDRPSATIRGRKMVKLAVSPYGGGD